MVLWVSLLDLSLAFISSLVRNVGGLIHSGDPIICSGLVSLILLSGLPLFGVWSQTLFSPCLCLCPSCLQLLSSSDFVTGCLGPLVPFGLETWRSGNLDPPHSDLRLRLSSGILEAFIMFRDSCTCLSRGEICLDKTLIRISCVAPPCSSMKCRVSGWVATPSMISFWCLAPL